MNVCEVRKKRIKLIEELSVKAFENHAIKGTLDQGLYRQWCCNNCGSSIHAFCVTTIPGSVIVTGDIGVLIVQRMPDTLAWARKAIRDISYFAEKVPAEIPTREYDSEVAKALCDELAHGDEPCEIDDLFNCVDDEWAFKQLLHESGKFDGCDFPDLTNWKPSFLWCREAVKWLLEHVQDKE